MASKPCPMCGRTAEIARDGTRTSFHIQCDRCGRFEMSDSLLMAMQEGLLASDSHLLPYLCAYTRQASESGARAFLTLENWRDLARSHMATPISQKTVRILELLASRSTHPGAAAYFDPGLDPPLLDSASSDEVEFLLEHLVKLGYIDRIPDYNIAGLSGFCITVKGWERLEPPTGRRIPGRCFIAMSFDPSLNDAFLLGIEPAVRECGFRPVNDLDHHPHAFVLACVMDRQIKAERAWLIPHLFSKKLGGFEFGTLQSLSIADVRNLMTRPEPLHRFPERMSENFHEAIRVIGEDYGGDASNIWRGKPPSAEVVYRFLQFRGVGPKIAIMATNILARDFKVPLSDYYSVDISADVQVRRVFCRLGLVGQDATTEEVIYRARALHPAFPGLMDFPAWEIGRNWCRPTTPLCRSCYMKEACLTARQAKTRRTG